jgi:hypothetical protein
MAKAPIEKALSSKKSALSKRDTEARKSNDKIKNMADQSSKDHGVHDAGKGKKGGMEKEVEKRAGKSQHKFVAKEAEEIEESDDREELDEKRMSKGTKDFNKIARSAGKEYGSKKAGIKVAAAVKHKIDAKKKRKPVKESIEEIIETQNPNLTMTLPLIVESLKWAANYVMTEDQIYEYVLSLLEAGDINGIRDLD